MPTPSAALPIARFVLRFVVVLNWVMLPVILALLFAVPNREWII